MTVFGLPATSNYSNHVRYSFDVDPSGTVYALAGAAPQTGPDKEPQHTWLVIKYNDDGAMDSFLKVGSESGKRIQPLRLAVFGDGDFPSEQMRNKLVAYHWAGG